MVDLESEIVALIDERPGATATVEELCEQLAAAGTDATAEQVAGACDDLVRAGELTVVGERSDSKEYARTKRT